MGGSVRQRLMNVVQQLATVKQVVDQHKNAVRFSLVPFRFLFAFVAVFQLASYSLY